MLDVEHSLAVSFERMCLVLILLSSWRVQPECTTNVQMYEKTVYLRVADAMRCKIQSSMFMPLYDSEARDRPIAVFEACQPEENVNFACLSSVLVSSLQVGSTVTSQAGCPCSSYMGFCSGSALSWGLCMKEPCMLGVLMAIVTLQKLDLYTVSLEERMMALGLRSSIVSPWGVPTWPSGGVGNARAGLGPAIAAALSWVQVAHSHADRSGRQPPRVGDNRLMNDEGARQTGSQTAPQGMPCSHRPPMSPDPDASCSAQECCGVLWRVVLAGSRDGLQTSDWQCKVLTWQMGFRCVQLSVPG